MKKKKLVTVLALSLTAVLLLFGLTGCGNEKKAAEKSVLDETEETALGETEKTALDETEETAEEHNDQSTVKETEQSEVSEQEEPTEADKMLETYYEEVLIPEQGLIELPSGYEVPIKERHFENYTIGEAFLQEKGICYHAVWDYDKDGQEEMLVLALDDDEDYERSKLYARMYEVETARTGKEGLGEVVQSAELESLFGWMEYDASQSTEIFLRETKDWFYLAEEARGYNAIYADGVCCAIRVAHYDGMDFVVDVAKQLSGSDFSGTEEIVAETAQLLTNIKFDYTAANLTYEYGFDKRDDLLSVFYISGEHNGSLDTYGRTGNISDVPPFLIRMFAGRE